MQNDERTPTTLEVLVGGVVVATTTNVVSTDDLLLSTTDPDGVTTTYTYDASTQPTGRHPKRTSDLPE